MKRSLVMALALAACSRVDVRQDLFRCESDADCLEGFRCTSGFCREAAPEAKEECHPTTCEAQGRTSGTIEDGCGGKLECGAVPGSTAWTPMAGDADAGAPGAYSAWTGRELVLWGGGVEYRVGEGYAYDLAIDDWRQLASQTHRNDPGVANPGVWTGKELLVWGGNNGLGCAGTGSRYDPVLNSWTAMTVTRAPDPRQDHVRVWTGREMIVWGGWCGTSGSEMNDGAMYDPVADTWTAMAPHPYVGRIGAAAVWTGRALLVYSGYTTGQGPLPHGVEYVPATGAWQEMGGTNAPSMVPVARASAVWTGREMIVFGGHGWPTPEATASVGRYDPERRAWTVMPTVNAPSPRWGHAAVWTGRDMIVWGGLQATDARSDTVLGDGARYELRTDTWFPVEAAGAPAPRSWPNAAWTGRELLIFGGLSGWRVTLSNGARYTPPSDAYSDSWETRYPDASPLVRSAHAMVWTGREMIVWGGTTAGCASVTMQGARYDPLTRDWTYMNDQPGWTTSGRASTSHAWTGKELLVWGGTDSSCYPQRSGGRYDPSADAWSPMSTVDAPSARYYAASVWTGRELIVWGGFEGNADVYTGARYDPQTDTWRAMPRTAGVASSRSRATAVWTGREALIWGGEVRVNEVWVQRPNGSAYDPAADAWRILPQDAARAGHSAVWTGKEMLVWGGYVQDGERTYLNTGAAYDPVADKWTPMPTAGAPSARAEHGAIWTGQEMVVWGGEAPSALADGAAYDPRAQAWKPIAATPPELAGRSQHPAVWTGRMMMIWGGVGSGVGTTLGVYYPR